MITGSYRLLGVSLWCAIYIVHCSVFCDRYNVLRSYKPNSDTKVYNLLQHPTVQTSVKGLFLRRKKPYGLNFGVFIDFAVGYTSGAFTSN